MELSEIREKRDELERAIEKLVTQFVTETDVEIAEIQFQPAVYSQRHEVTPVEISVELII